MKLTVVTSCFNYGHYLHDWADSIVRSSLKPAAVCIVNNGSTDGTQEIIRTIATRLGEAGIETLACTIDRVDFGTARNVAVALSQTEWVMHLDADDMLMPHGLADAATLASRADVIALGYERCGHLSAGPRNRTRVYRDSIGEEAVQSIAPASGVSPFRRRFWQQRPYRTDMQGGWDTALWRGFAHLGARFVATKRPTFWYRQHADSIFNLRRNHDRKAAFAGQKLASVARADAGLSILVPLRLDGGYRDRAWEWNRRRLEDLHPDAEIVVGQHQSGLWNKGTAVWDAMTRSSGDLLLILDADCALSADSIARAVGKVREGAPWVVPHTNVYRYRQGRTDEILARDPALDLKEDPTEPAGLIRMPYVGYAGGGAFVVRRSDYEAAGGIPRCFQGWGCEDEAMGYVLDTLVGPHVRLEDNLIHLWHGKGLRARAQEHGKNRRLLASFMVAVGNPDAMWRVVTGGASERDVRVRMIALDAFRRGTQRFKPGDTFIASAVEARRHAARAEPVARPFRAGDLEVVKREQSSPMVFRRRQSQRTVEVAVHRNLEEERLAAAGRKLRERRTMAGARDIRRETIRRRRAQQEENARARAETEARVAAAESTLTLTPSQQRRANLHKRQTQDVQTRRGHRTTTVLGDQGKQDKGEFEDKMQRKGTKDEDKSDKGENEENIFASPQAKDLAESEGVDLEVLQQYEPSSEKGYTVEDIRAIIEEEE